MAQKTENEETEFKVVPDTTITLLCVNCGVATNNSASCQKCLSPPTSPKPLKSFRSSSVFKTLPERNLNPAGTSRDLKDSAAEPVKRVVNRCSGCRRKVGLTGFRCRCGDLFCADHRYSDRHDCSYDYKTAGREAIARENPVVKAAKIVKI